MPRIFQKDSEINVIEYGDHCFQPLSFKGIWNAFAALFKAA
jgi:hypothetical protein